MSNPMIEFNQVKKSYDGKEWVIKNLNLSINKGEFVTLLGPSGSGKTTLLMMLAGFESITEGEIYLENQTINKLPAYKRNIGVVFQDYALFPHMDVYNNIAFPLKLRKYSPQHINHKIDDVLNLVNMLNFKHKAVTKLSGGQQQRIALARALAFEPGILLLDEPLSALDRQLREKMQYELRSLQKKLNITFLYVTHDQKEALVMSDKIAVLSNGILQQYDTSENLYNRPRNKFVASFFGENNLVEYQVGTQSSQIDFQSLLGSDIHFHAADFANYTDNTTLAIRPEHITLSRDKSDADFSVSAKIDQIYFMGDFYRINATVNNQLKLAIKLKSLSSTLHENIEVNQRIYLNWYLKNCAFF